jgi:hypothetical protein
MAKESQISLTYDLAADMPDAGVGFLGVEIFRYLGRADFDEQTLFRNPKSEIREAIAEPTAGINRTKFPSP